MKVLERLELVEKIGRELQSRMTFRDIDTYLAAYGVRTEGAIPSVNSKYVYVKDLLSKAQEALILQIAEELNIEHKTAGASHKEVTFWKAGYFRLFISHLALFKVQTANLQAVLRRYGISAFVAHEDIEPSKEWQMEIESALQTMDAMAVLLMPGFKESNWCDQEVGFAVGRDVLIIPVRRGLDPYGFIGKYQAIQGVGKTTGQVVEAIFQTITRAPRTREKMLGVLATLIGTASSVGDANAMLALFSPLLGIPVEIIASLRQQALENAVLRDDKMFVDRLNKTLTKYGMEGIKVGATTGAPTWDDDIPF